VQNRDAKRTGVGEAAQAIERLGLFRGQLPRSDLGSDRWSDLGTARWSDLGADRWSDLAFDRWSDLGFDRWSDLDSDRWSDLGAYLLRRGERIAVDFVAPYADVAMADEAGDGIGCDPARGEHWRRQAGGRSCDQFEGVARFFGQRAGPRGFVVRLPYARRRGTRDVERLDSRRRNRCDPHGFVRVDPSAARHRRQQRGNRVADAGRVILRRPPRQRDDVGRHEWMRVENLTNGLDRRTTAAGRRMVDDNPRDDPRTQRHDHARADRRCVEILGNGVGEKVEAGNRNCD
jgi:hypothetical protein